VFPWLWIFAPQTYWPLSGAVTQDVSLDAFFRGIKPGAGVPGIEQRVFEHASYGKQLGWLTEVVIDAVDRQGAPSADAREALDRLKALRADVERIKGDVRRDRAEAAMALLDSLAADSPEELDRLLRRYEGGARARR
jgi:hypothetical protein